MNFKSKMQDSEIECLLFSEFHPIAGRKITYQVPKECVTKEMFDALSVYIIPKPKLRGKLMAVNALGYKIIGYPVLIDDRKYARNQLIFNLCFVCKDSKKTVQYEPLVRKLSNYLVTLELESNFLSNEESKSRLPDIMAKICNDLNKKGRCSISINDSNTIHLKVVRVHHDPLEVSDHDVPVFVESKTSLLPSQWDLTTQQILPYVDGFRHVARIAAEAEVEVSLYSNVYMPTPDINNLAQLSSLREAALKFVAKEGRPPPTFKNLFMLYCNLSPGITIRDICTRFNPHTLGIDERKLVQFGLLKGLIRRLEKYPVVLNVSDNVPVSKHKNSIEKYFTGTYSYDQICCKTGLSHMELDEIIEHDSNVVVCWK